MLSVVSINMQTLKVLLVIITQGLSMGKIYNF